MKVVVIGAGIIGVSIADALAAGGAEVSVLDMRSAGAGASHASAGMLAPYAEAHGDQTLLALGARSLALFDDYVERLAEESGRAIEYARAGSLEVTMDAADVERLRARAGELTAAGIAAEFLTEASLRDYEPTVSPAVLAGLVTPIHGAVGVMSLVRALVHRARLNGAVFEEPVQATGVEGLRQGVRISLGQTRREADAVVIAAGSWSRRVRIAHAAALPVRPVRGQLLRLRWTAGDPPRRIVWGPECYAVPWQDGTLLVGATVEDAGFDEHATAAGVQGLLSAVMALTPAASSAHLASVEVGLRPALPDGVPAIGPAAVSRHVVLATGHYRNGILLAPLTASIVARYLLEGIEDDAFHFTSPARF